MNKRRKRILGAWVGTVVWFGLWPPWVIGQESLGYNFLFASSQNGRVDISRLSLEWLVASVIAAALYFGWTSPIRPHVAGFIGSGLALVVSLSVLAGTVSAHVYEEAPSSLIELIQRFGVSMAAQFVCIAVAAYLAIEANRKRRSSSPKKET